MNPISKNNLSIELCINEKNVADALLNNPNVKVTTQKDNKGFPNLWEIWRMISPGYSTERIKLSSFGDNLLNIAIHTLNANEKERLNKEGGLGWVEKLFWQPLTIGEGENSFTILVNISSVKKRLRDSGFSKDEIKNFLKEGVTENFARHLENDVKNKFSNNIHSAILEHDASYYYGGDNKEHRFYKNSIENQLTEWFFSGKINNEDVQNILDKHFSSKKPQFFSLQMLTNYIHFQEVLKTFQGDTENYEILSKIDEINFNKLYLFHTDLNSGRETQIDNIKEAIHNYLEEYKAQKSKEIEDQKENELFHQIYVKIEKNLVSSSKDHYQNLSDIELRECTYLLFSQIKYKNIEENDIDGILKETKEIQKNLKEPISFLEAIKKAQKRYFVALVSVETTEDPKQQEILRKHLNDIPLLGRTREDVINTYRAASQEFFEKFAPIYEAYEKSEEKEFFGFTLEPKVVAAIYKIKTMWNVSIEEAIQKSFSFNERNNEPNLECIFLQKIEKMGHVPIDIKNSVANTLTDFVFSKQLSFEEANQFLPFLEENMDLKQVSKMFYLYFDVLVLGKTLQKLTLENSFTEQERKIVHEDLITKRGIEIFQVLQEYFIAQKKADPVKEAIFTFIDLHNRLL